MSYSHFSQSQREVGHPAMKSSVETRKANERIAEWIVVYLSESHLLKTEKGGATL
jgi:hypothetical protein